MLENQKRLFLTGGGGLNPLTGPPSNVKLLTVLNLDLHRSNLDLHQELQEQNKKKQKKIYNYLFLFAYVQIDLPENRYAAEILLKKMMSLYMGCMSLYYILLYDFMSGTAHGIFWYVHLVYEGNPIAADRWLKAIRRAFSQVDTPSEFWVDFAAYRLTGDAVIWWENLSIQRDMTGVDWEVFEGLFRDNYFNAGHRRMLADMFENIE
ncbi:hypothetical protein ACOSQ2_003367 [Xanthoceras sorbifolium]